MAGLRPRLRTSALAFGAVFRNPSLRWLELAWTASIVGHWAYLVAVSVYAYEQGGERAVGLVFLLRLVPAAIISPFAGLLADRYPRHRVLLATNAARIGFVGAAAACVLAETRPEFVYGLAIGAAIVTTPFRSAQAALTPALARSPEELTAANAVASGVESLAVFAGPALAGLVLAATDTGIAFLVTAALLVVSSVFLLLVKPEQADAPRREIETGTIASEALAGFRAIGRDSSLRVLMVLLTAQTAVAGAVQVFIVVAAIDLLDLGTGGVGYLNSAIGAGALVGAVLSLSLAGARRLSPVFVAGIALWGLPLAVIGLWPGAALALVLFAVIGFGNSLVDVSGLTLVQRAVPDNVLARVFGVIQMLWLGSLGIGAALAPFLVDLLGIETALVATGILLPVLVTVLGARLVRIDATAEPPDRDELRILAAIPIFAPLPGASLEHLAGRLTPRRIETDEIVFREGETGDRFYIVAAGTVAITELGRPIAELGPGSYFGEIALLRDVPRTATAVARTPVVLYALDRDDFLATVTSHAPSAEAAEEVVSSRLAGVPVAGARLPAG